jgi:hypothetical protein
MNQLVPKQQLLYFTLPGRHLQAIHPYSNHSNTTTIMGNLGSKSKHDGQQQEPTTTTTNKEDTEDQRDIVEALPEQMTNLNLATIHTRGGGAIAFHGTGRTVAAAGTPISASRGIQTTNAGTTSKKEKSARSTPFVARQRARGTPFLTRQQHAIGFDEWTPPPTQNLVTPDAPQTVASRPPSTPFPHPTPVVLNFQSAIRQQHPLLFGQVLESLDQITPPPTISVATPLAPSRRAPRNSNRRFPQLSRGISPPQTPGHSMAARLDDRFWDYFGNDDDDDEKIIKEEEVSEEVAVKLEDEKPAAIVKTEETTKDTVEQEPTASIKMEDKTIKKEE